MKTVITRRGVVAGGFVVTACAPRPKVDISTSFPRFAAIEARIGGRVGAAAWNTETDAWLKHRPNEHFALCSTFKWALTAAQLHMAEHGGPQLSEHLRFDESDMLSYAPTARNHLARGWMTIEEACQAATSLSDNTAANLLLDIQGGPEGFTRFLRANGDTATRLDRYEIELNDVSPGDDRDTTTPDAMVRTLHRFLLQEGVLSGAMREKLINWMAESPTGHARLRAGFPGDWRVADKTGTWTAENNATNTVAITWPPNRGPIVVACYRHLSIGDLAARNGAHADVARIITEEWG